MTVQRRIGTLAVMGAVIFMVNLLVEYQFELFPDEKTGTGVVISQVVFFAAMVCWLVATALLALSMGLGRFARISLWIHFVGLAGLFVTGLVTINQGEQDNALFAIFGLLMILGGLLGGIALFRDWRGQGVRWAGLTFSALFLVFFLSGEPQLWNEMAWPLAWLILGTWMLRSPAQISTPESEALAG